MPLHPGHPGHHGDVGPHERDEAADDERLVAVAVEERGRLVEVLALDDAAVALVERLPDLAPDLVADDVAEERGDDQRRHRDEQLDEGRTREQVELAGGDEEADREQERVAGEDREEQPALDEDDDQADPEQRRAEPVEQPVGVHPVDAEEHRLDARGQDGLQVPQRAHARNPNCGRPCLRASSRLPRVLPCRTRSGRRTTRCRTARPRWEWVRGRGRGPRASSGTPTCCARVIAATWWTATATGAWRRSSPTSTPAGTASTSRSRTGSTTSTSARSCAPPTPSSPPRCTSSATAGGTAAARW